jgi:uncharacterized protein (DUF1778 family)
MGGKNMTDFKVPALHRTEVIRLSLDDQECFAEALLSPPKLAPALERAFTRQSKLLSPS